MCEYMQCVCFCVFSTFADIYDNYVYIHWCITVRYSGAVHHMSVSMPHHRAWHVWKRMFVHASVCAMCLCVGVCL